MIQFPDLGELTQEVGAILQQFYQLEQSVATANQQQTIETATLQTESMVQQILDIVRQIQADTQYIRTALGIVDNRLLSAIGTPQQASTPVVLPSTPPSGYGAPTTSAVATAVWGALSADEATSFGAVVAGLSAFLRICGDSLAFPGRLGSWATYNFAPYDWVNNPNTSWIEIDAGTILPTHANVLAWLNDVYFHQTWVDTGDGTYWSSVGSPSGHALVYVTMTQGEFLWLQELNAHGVPKAEVPPIWPGLADVNLGTPVSLAGTGITVTGPMDGILLALTTVPQPRPQYDFNGTVSWGKMGGVAFEDDNGDTEEQQLIGFEHAVYAPKSMKQASFCNLRYPSGTLGTATPWTRT